jgi:hypothetical protein
MKRKDKFTLVGVALVTAIVSLIIANAIFSKPTKHDSEAPVVETIPATLPDVKNDSSYNVFLNEKALDPTQPVQIGNSQNQAPFR